MTDATPAEEPVQNLIERSGHLLAQELARIAATPPFDKVPSSHLARILADADILFFRHGKIVCHPAITENGIRLWIVRHGSVHATPLVEGLAQAERLEVGAIFPLESFLTVAPPVHVFAAAEDSSLWELSGEVLQRLRSEPAILRWIAQRLQLANTGLRDTVTELLHGRQLSDQALALPAHTAGSDRLVVVPEQTPVRNVAELMAARAVGAVVVGSPEATVGIVTQTDLIRRVMAAELDYATPVAAIMTPRPVTIDSTTTVLSAGLDMARHGFRHLLVREQGGPVVGVVSERDLLRIQLHGIGHLLQPVDAAQSVDELTTLAAHIRGFAVRAFRQGMEVSEFTRLLSSINDRLTQRLLTLVAGENGFTDRFCWLAFGSEGREEQGFVTDQDNGIVFVAPATMDLDAVRRDYLEIASRMNQGLHRCGFELCKGNIMASNPKYCLSLDEWQGKFSRWIHASAPMALLNANIFFDFRGIYGNKELAEHLHEHIFAEIRHNTLFLQTLATNALAVAPPLGKWSRFHSGGEEKGSVDLKARGSRLFVDAARVFALAAGVRTANTEQRLRAAGKQISRAASAIEGDVAAFRFIQAIRLRRQLDSLKDGKAANQLDPYTLNDLDQRMLLESLRQAGILQARLKLDYRQ